MISIETFRNQFMSSSNTWRNGSVSPSRLNLFLNQASVELFNEKTERAGKSRKLDDDLRPFLKSVNLPVTVEVGVNYGLTVRPSDYDYFWSMRAFFAETSKGKVSCACPDAENAKECDATLNLPAEEISLEEIKIVDEVEVVKVDSGEWAGLLSHRFKNPTLQKPACTQFDEGFKVAPRNLNVVTLDFYRLPKPAVFGYTVNSNNNIVYSPSLSTDIEWPATMLNELLDRTMIIFSNYLRDNSMLQYSELQKQTRI